MALASAARNNPALPDVREHRLRLKLLTAALLFAGLLLRVFFVRRHGFLAADSLLYQDIAQSWLHAHIYGLSNGPVPRPTLIRLPGYPAILAAMSWAFDRFLNADTGTLASFLPVLWLQVFADLATCWLAARITRALYSQRAATAALAIGCLCPFTANYTAVPLTESFTIFFLALAFWLLLRWLQQPSYVRLTAVALAISCGVLLRPDQGVLALAILPVLFFARPARTQFRQRLVPVVVCVVIAAAPFVPWTLRNMRTFHVFQPLAPKLANDPGEVPPVGFQRWYRTWAVDFNSTQDAYWKYPEEAIQVADLPGRAFDSPQEKAYVTSLLQQDRWTQRQDPNIEARFADLGRARARRHPLRTFLVLPVARVLNMLLHPRTEMLPVAELWWQYWLHPAQTLFAWWYAALNLAYFAAAAVGAARFIRKTQANDAGRAVAWSMLGYVALRCAVLLTIDNPEQRYTLEFFPILFVFAGALWTERRA
ncbi:MAG: glycosyltransferase family 39 protein [Janthinobacterium lividum]